MASKNMYALWKLNVHFTTLLSNFRHHSPCGANDIRAVLHEICEGWFLPSLFHGDHKKYGTPHWGLTLPFVLSVMILLFVRDFTILGAMLNFGLLFMVSLVLLFAYNLPKKHPEIFAHSRYKFTPTILRITSLSAAIFNIIFMLLLIFIMFKSKNQWAVCLRDRDYRGIGPLLHQEKDGSCQKTGNSNRLQEV